MVVSKLFIKERRHNICNTPYDKAPTTEHLYDLLLEQYKRVLLCDASDNHPSASDRQVMYVC
jgi:hypothetical protein